ncbi:hypothetical protein [Lentzea sp. NPDC060358]|uniref:hypothetical protein n=1 Tax=Lentzea sp. NPDC060358 TaxID=3347103 RepID=UPI0036502041
MKKTTALLFAALMALTACASLPAENEQKKDDKADMVKFAQCMRDNGIEMPDPQGDGGAVTLGIPGNDGDGEKMSAAHNACKQHLPNGGEFTPPSPEEQDKMRQQAKCMRDRGYNWPDPKFEGGGAAGEAIELPDMEDEKVKQDMKDCGLGEGGMVAARPAG